MTEPGKIINIGNPLSKWNQAHFPIDLRSAIAGFKQHGGIESCEITLHRLIGILSVSLRGCGIVDNI